MIDLVYAWCDVDARVFYRLNRAKYLVFNIYDATLKIIAVAKVKAAAAPPSSVMNSRRFIQSPYRRGRAGSVAHRDHRFGGFELVHALLAIDHAHTLLGTACISSASAALKLRSPGAAPL
jgi:hypothetical protein